MKHILLIADILTVLTVVAFGAMLIYWFLKVSLHVFAGG